MYADCGAYFPMSSQMLCSRHRPSGAYPQSDIADDITSKVQITVEHRQE